MSKATKNNTGDFFLHIHIAQSLERVVWSVSEVIHPNWFFFWNPEPGAVISCGIQKFEALPDHAYLIPPYTTISGGSDKPFTHLYAHFEVSEPFVNVNRKIYQLDPAPARKFYRERFMLVNPRKMLYWRIMLMEYLAMLPNDDLNNNTSYQDERIFRVLESLNNNWQHIPDNRVLAQRAGMSVNNFYRHFREMLGISPQRYLTSMRLTGARNLLINETSSIEEIAVICGFSDRYSFSKAFKQYFGIAPGAFRNNERSKNITAENSSYINPENDE